MLSSQGNGSALFWVPPKVCFWLWTSPELLRNEASSERLLLLFIVFCRGWFSKHKAKGHRSFKFFITFWNIRIWNQNTYLLILKKSSHTSNSCHIYSANLLNHLKWNCPLLKKKETHALDLHIAFICISMHIHTPHFTLNLSLYYLYLYPFAVSKYICPFLNSTKYASESILKKLYLVRLCNKAELCWKSYTNTQSFQQQ